MFFTIGIPPHLLPVGSFDSVFLQRNISLILREHLPIFAVVICEFFLYNFVNVGLVIQCVIRRISFPLIRSQ